MHLPNIVATLRSRVRYLRYSRSKAGDFSQAMADTVLLNPRRHPVLMGPEELSRYFVYSANRELRRR